MNTSLLGPGLLIIEDDIHVAGSLAQGLTEHGYRATVAASGEDGFYRFVTDRPQVVVLDLNLPSRDGIDVLRAMRAQPGEAHVIIVSARDTVDDRVAGLNAGADDYLVKPFAFAELLARLRALERRGVANTAVITVADLEVERSARRVRRAGGGIDLTIREYEILELLARHHGQIVTRRTIADEVWRVARATPLDNVIDVHIMHLRRKIDLPDLPPLLHTIRGVGFRLGTAESGAL